MPATLTVGGVSVIMIEDTLDLTTTVDEKQRFQCDLIDYVGVHFQKGAQVVLTDPILGIMYSGFLNTDKEVPQYPSTYIVHSIDCTDNRTLADNRTYTATYTLPATAGKIFVDQLEATLASEGITSGYAQHDDETDADFAMGINTNTESNDALSSLKLLDSGSDLSIMESTTANFSTGTLVGVVAGSNQLTPTSTTAIECIASLLGTLAGSYMAINIWTGSMTIAVNDTLNYDLWISSTSPQDAIGIDLYFTDGTKMSDATTAIDQNQISANPFTDLSSVASNTWYTRNITLAGLNGKIISTVVITTAGQSAGQYTSFVKNCYLGSQTGNKFFTAGSTTANVNPPQIYKYAGYSITNVSCFVSNVFIANNAFRISPTYAVSSVGLLSNSLITWLSNPTTGVGISASYDGGLSYVACTNSEPLPALPAGTNMSTVSLTLKENFSTAGTTDPSIFPVLDDVIVSLESAPIATKSDITQSYITAANWNTGTFANTILASNNLTLGSITRNWNDNTISNQTLFAIAGVTQSASSGNYAITSPSVSGIGLGAYWGHSRLDFALQLVDFTLEADIKCNNSVTYNQENGTGLPNNFQTLSSEAGITYRNSSYSSSNANVLGYLLTMYPNTSSGGFSNQGYIVLYSGSITGAITVLASTNLNVVVGTAYHIKIVVNGTRHRIYFNNSVTPTLDINDSTYQQIGSFGFRMYSHAQEIVFTGSSSTIVYSWASMTASIDNIVITPLQTGTWTSAPISISSLSHCGLSSIYWTESGTTNQALSSVIVETSIDSGVTYLQCTSSGAIPNLTDGDSVAGKSIIIKVILTTISQLYLPVVSGLVMRVLGQYPGSSGNRTTIPLGNDTFVRSNVGSGWGTAFDSQTYVQVGTATTSLVSNQGIITNTTGDMRMVYGTRTWTDMDATMRLLLTTSTIQAGIELRWVDSNDFYRFAFSTTSAYVFKIRNGISITLQTVSVSLSTNTLYRMRFRIVGANPATVEGRIWLDGTLEPTTWTATGQG